MKEIENCHIKAVNESKIRASIIKFQKQKGFYSMFLSDFISHEYVNSSN